MSTQQKPEQAEAGCSSGRWLLFQATLSQPHFPPKLTDMGEQPGGEVSQQSGEAAHDCLWGRRLVEEVEGDIGLHYGHLQAAAGRRGLCGWVAGSGAEQQGREKERDNPRWHTSALAPEPYMCAVGVQGERAKKVMLPPLASAAACSWSGAGAGRPSI